MTESARWALIGAGLLAVADWSAVALHTRTVRYLTKPAVMVMLIAAAVSLRPASSAERTWMVVGLGLGLAGDVLLLHDGSRPFLAGLLAFLAGHLAYIAAFTALSQHSSPAALAAGLALVIGILLVPVYVRSLRASGRSYLVFPVLAYVLVITAMLIVAWGTALPLAMAGALLFFASDAELAWDRFVKPIRRGRLINIVLYQSGQAALVASLVSTTIG